MKSIYMLNLQYRIEKVARWRIRVRELNIDTLSGFRELLGT